MDPMGLAGEKHKRWLKANQSNWGSLGGLECISYPTRAQRFGLRGMGDAFQEIPYPSWPGPELAPKLPQRLAWREQQQQLLSLAHDLARFAAQRSWRTMWIFFYKIKHINSRNIIRKIFLEFKARHTVVAIKKPEGTIFWIDPIIWKKCGLNAFTLATSGALGICSSRAATRSQSRKPDINCERNPRLISGNWLAGAICSNLRRKKRKAPQAWCNLTASLYISGERSGAAVESKLWMILSM